MEKGHVDGDEPEELDNRQIDRLLDEARPDTYEAGDKTWRTPVYDRVAEAIDKDTAPKRAAKEIVDKREARATRSVNALLRKIVTTGQFPLDWLDYKDRPLVVGEVRKRLETVTSEDLRQFAIDERRRCNDEFVARVAACTGAEQLADQMDANDWANVGVAGKNSDATTLSTDDFDDEDDEDDEEF